MCVTHSILNKLQLNFQSLRHHAAGVFDNKIQDDANFQEA